MCQTLGPGLQKTLGQKSLICVDRVISFFEIFNGIPRVKIRKTNFYLRRVHLRRIAFRARWRIKSGLKQWISFMHLQTETHCSARKFCWRAKLKFKFYFYSSQPFLLVLINILGPSTFGPQEISTRPLRVMKVGDGPSCICMNIIVLSSVYIIGDPTRLERHRQHVLTNIKFLLFTLQLFHSNEKVALFEPYMFKKYLFLNIKIRISWMSCLSILRCRSIRGCISIFQPSRCVILIVDSNSRQYGKYNLL
jgi:hypothetical protein